MKRIVQAAALARTLSAVILVAATGAWAQPSHSAPANADSVVRGLQNDDMLLERVANAIANDPQLAGVDITVVVVEGRVALAGETQTAGQAVRAVAVTRRAAGSDVEVRSELRADEPHDAAAA